MAIRIHTTAVDFEARFSAFLATKREVSPEVDEAVRDIVARVRAEGDAALIDYSRRFDRAELTAASLAVSRTDIEAAYRVADKDTVAALTLARDRIASHHRRQRPTDDRYTDPLGVELGSRWTAIEAVGLYVPGGTAAYPSSVLMNAIPARVAGVERIVMVSPTPDGVLNPLVVGVKLPFSHAPYSCFQFLDDRRRSSIPSANSAQMRHIVERCEATVAATHVSYCAWTGFFLGHGAIVTVASVLGLGGEGSPSLITIMCLTDAGFVSNSLIAFVIAGSKSGMSPGAIRPMRATIDFC